MLLIKSRRACCTLALAFVINSPVYAGKTTQINLDPNGKDLGLLSISADGRYMAFSSASPHIVAEDNNRWSDVFVRDLLTQKTVRVSVNSAGVSGDDDSWASIISADGRYVVFSSIASNLVANDTNAIKGGKAGEIQDVFVHDTVTKQTTRVSVSSKGVQGDSYSSAGDISADGRYVAFTSTATTLVSPDSNKYWEDVFIHDRLTKQTTRISESSKGIQGNRRSLRPKLSADGRYVAFLSNARNLVANDTNLTTDVFVHDRLLKKTTLESVSYKGVQGSAYWDLENYGISLSADGSKVAFMSDATQLVRNDTNNVTDIFVRDRVKKQTWRINESSNGAQSILKGYLPNISDDGRFVGFSSKTFNLVANDNNNEIDAFVHDSKTKQTIRTSVKSNGKEQTVYSMLDDISADGRYSIFVSPASKAKNSGYNVFIRDQLLDTQHHADLKISLAKNVASLQPNTKGTFTYFITNAGPHPIKDVSLLHLLSEPNTTSFKISQGDCSVAPVETICHLGKLAAGKSLQLQVTITAKKDTFTQKVRVSGEPVDAMPTNNAIDVVTPVKTKPNGGGSGGGNGNGNGNGNGGDYGGGEDSD